MAARNPAFAPVDPSVRFPALEAEILEFWAEIGAFERSVEQRPPESAYVFYDGPPFATGLPHYGHLVASTLKDIVPRYWAMRGHRVERRFGWDTHGLPIEMEMEKTLGLNGPSSVREYGVAKFNETCRENVLRYTREWRQVVTRLGRWVDFDNDYKTMDPSFMESVWWVFGQLWEKGLVYRDLRVMPYSWRLSTSLSNFEANLDYRDVDDPAITVKMPIVGDDAALLIWTTTPWTLPSNLAVAVGTDIDYVRASRAADHADQGVYILAKERLEAVLGKDAVVHATVKGAELVGTRYAPLFPYFADHANAFQVITSEDVTTEDGTGLVHMAPAYGEADFVACRAVGIEVVDPVDDEGRFTAAITDFAGRNIKEADPDIIRAIKDGGRLLHRGQINHSYPFCWRSGTPLIYKTVPGWFVKVEALRDRMVAHNQHIHWVPEAVGSKRFGNWLADARDWNVSRARFWGTPIPIWECSADPSHRVAVSSIAQLEELTGATVDDLHPHKIDHLTFTCPHCADGAGEMRRIRDVFDCWFESGAMPYAQGHYPFEGRETFEANFPAQFIAEGLDQTRGWFYTLLVLSTALFDAPPFRNVIVNGMVLAEDGSKMSKSKRNYPDPSHVLEEYGADALRAYLIDSPVVRAEPLRFSETGVREVVRTVLLPLRNAWSFLVQYANIDGWHPGTGLDGTPTPPPDERPELDRWLLSVLQSLVRDVNQEMEGYYLYRVVDPMVGFIDHLTNWYIRRSRRRFWRSADDADARQDKACAYATLYDALVTFSKVIAPVLPFIADAVYRNLVVETGCAEEGRESVHLCDYPEVDADRIDETLETDVALVRQVVTMGRALRKTHDLKVRQPLRKVTVVHHEAHVRDAILQHADQITDELNLKDVEVVEDDHDLATLSFKPNFRALGPRFGKQMKAVAKFVAGLTTEQWDTLRDGGALRPLDDVDEPIRADDLLVQRTPRGEVIIETAGALTVALDTHLDEGLIREGLVREVTSRVQRLRKETGLAVTDRIRLTFFCDGELNAALQAHAGAVAEEVLATAVGFNEADLPADAAELDVEGHRLHVVLSKDVEPA